MSKKYEETIYRKGKKKSPSSIWKNACFHLPEAKLKLPLDP